jgi:hypothetical protein
VNAVEKLLSGFPLRLPVFAGGFHCFLEVVNTFTMSATGPAWSTLGPAFTIAATLIVFKNEPANHQFVDYRSDTVDLAGKAYGEPLLCLGPDSAGKGYDAIRGFDLDVLALQRSMLIQLRLYSFHQRRVVGL